MDDNEAKRIPDDLLYVENKDGSVRHPATYDEWFGREPFRILHFVGDVDNINKGALVSTVFLGMDHNWMRSGEPLLYETAISIVGCGIDVVERYRTREEAALGHAEHLNRMVARFGGVARNLSPER